MPSLNKDDVANKTAHVRDVPPLTADQANATDTRHRDRLRSLRDVVRFGRAGLVLSRVAPPPPA